MYSHSSDGGSKLSLLGGSLNSRSKRSFGKRGKWTKKKRAGMSFLIVIAFFTVFALIILAEVFMIDEKNKSQGFSVGGGGGSGLRHSGYNRFGESVPDYDEVKDEYSIENAVFMRNRFRNKHRGESFFLAHSSSIHIFEQCFYFFLSLQTPMSNLKIQMGFQLVLHGDPCYL